MTIWAVAVITTAHAFRIGVERMGAFPFEFAVFFHNSLDSYRRERQQDEKQRRNQEYPVHYAQTIK